MRKTILMLLLCAPLAWITGDEGQQVYKISTWTTPQAKAQEGHDLEKTKRTADAIVDLPEGLAAAILRLDGSPQAPPADPALGEPARELVNAVLDHAKARAKGRNRVDEARREAADKGNAIQLALERIRGGNGRLSEKELERLGELLVVYEKLRAYDPEMLASARAEADWADLENKHPRSRLDELYDQLDHWSPTASTAGASLPDPAELEKHADAYRRFLDEYRLVKGAYVVDVRRQANERFELWERGAKLVKLLGLEADKRDKQIDEIVKLAEDNRSGRIEATTRRLVQLLCDDLLKPEPYDDEVLLISGQQAAPERVQRKLIKIRRKDQKVVGLDESGLDEYTLRREGVENFLLPMGNVRDLPDDETVAPLRGTEYTEAIRAFNLQRAQIKQWSGTELRKLRQTCEQHQAALAQGGAKSGGGPTLIGRIDRLLDIVRHHPNQFVASVP